MSAIHHIIRPGEYLEGDLTSAFGDDRSNDTRMNFIEFFETTPEGRSILWRPDRHVWTTFPHVPDAQVFSTIVRGGDENNTTRTDVVPAFGTSAKNIEYLSGLYHTEGFCAVALGYILHTVSAVKTVYFQGARRSPGRGIQITKKTFISADGVFSLIVATISEVIEKKEEPIMLMRSVPILIETRNVVDVMKQYARDNNLIVDEEAIDSAMRVKNKGFIKDRITFTVNYVTPANKVIGVQVMTEHANTVGIRPYGTHEDAHFTAGGKNVLLQFGIFCERYKIQGYSAAVARILFSMADQSTESTFNFVISDENIITEVHVK